MILKDSVSQSFLIWPPDCFLPVPLPPPHFTDWPFSPVVCYTIYMINEPTAPEIPWGPTGA